jgi:hypothetical protein
MRKWVTEVLTSLPVSSSVMRPKQVVWETGRFHSLMLTFSRTKR